MTQPASRPRRILQRALVVVGATAVGSGALALAVLQPWKTKPPVSAARIDAELELASRLDVELVSDTSSGTVLVDVGPWGPLCLSQGRASWPAGRHQLFVVADEEVTSPRRVQLRAAPPSLTPYP